MLIGCLLSQKFDKTLLHHLTLNGFAEAVIGLNIPHERRHRRCWLRKCLLLPNSQFYTYVWPCSGRAQTEHLLSALKPIKVKSWNLMCLKNRSYKKSRCVPKTNFFLYSNFTHKTMNRTKNKKIIECFKRKYDFIFQLQNLKFNSMCYLVFLCNCLVNLLAISKWKFFIRQCIFFSLSQCGGQNEQLSCGKQGKDSPKMFKKKKKTIILCVWNIVRVRKYWHFSSFLN